MPHRRAGLHDRVDLVSLALADQVAHGGGRHEHLAGDHAPRAVARWAAAAGSDPLQRHRELHADLLLLVGREHVDDAVDRLRRRPGCAAWRTRGGRSRPRSAPWRSSPGRASRRRGSRPGPGAGRRFRAAAKDCASAPSSRWLTMHFLCPCRNSIGSSIVMMCSSREPLIASIIAASEVDLPEPVGPVTSTKPRGLRVNSCSAGAAPARRSSSARTGSDGRRRRWRRAGSRR